MTTTAAPFGLYIHIPFCLQRCAYCDFFSSAGKTALLPRYVRALQTELQMVGGAGSRPSVDTVYLGGGTPSLIPSKAMAGVMGAIREGFQLDACAEVTLEANPGPTTESALEAFAASGINRLSLGMQSADATELKMLGRIHTFEDTLTSVEAARRTGWKNLSLDLMFGLPNQTLDSWRSTVRKALCLQPQHLSLYALTLESGTPLAEGVRRSRLPEPDDDAAADMYEAAEDILAEAGFRQYEISNWARDSAPAMGRASGRFPSFASRHNLRYWQNQPYLGFGAGAHGCVHDRRYSVIRSIEAYIERIESGSAKRFPFSPAVTVRRRRTREDEMRETVWLGLRLTEAGVNLADYRFWFGEWPEEFQRAAEQSMAEGLLETVEGGNRIRLTRRGRLLGNQVFRRFV